MSAALQVKSVSKRFGGLRAVDEVSLTAQPGSVLGVIGQNGAGKTTLFNMIAGTLPASSGQILIGDTDVTKLAAWQRSLLGVGRTFQIPQPISSLTVKENVQVGLVAHGSSLTASATAADSYLADLGIAHLAGLGPAKLSPGQLRILEFARAAALGPKIFLLDEIFAGLNDEERRSTSEVVLSLKQKNIAIVWIEHNVRLMMSLADRIVAMDQGRIIAEGLPEEIARNERVISAYLGGAARAG